MELAEICKILKRARIDKNISLQDVSRQTRLPPNVLGKIEGAQDLASLGKFYLKGFLKIYSQFLDQDDLIKEIDASLPKDKDKEKRSIFKFPVEKKPASKDIRSAREAQKKQIKKEEKQKEYTPPPTREKLKSEDAVISLRSNLPVVKLGVKISLVIILLVAVLLLLKLPPKKTIEKQASPPPIKKQVQTEKPKPVPLKKEIIKPLVSILTKGNVFVEVKADSKLIFQNIIIEGIKESWIAKENLEIKLSNPSLVSLEIGTKSIPTSNTKRPATYVITPEGFQVRK